MYSEDHGAGGGPSEPEGSEREQEIVVRQMAGTMALHAACEYVWGSPYGAVRTASMAGMALSLATRWNHRLDVPRIKLLEKLMNAAGEAAATVDIARAIASTPDDADEEQRQQLATEVMGQLKEAAALGYNAREIISKAVELAFRAAVGERTIAPDGAVIAPLFTAFGDPDAGEDE